MLLLIDDFGPTQELASAPHGQDRYPTFLDSIDHAVLAVRDFAVVGKLDFRDDPASSWKPLQPVGRFEESIKPPQRGVGFVLGDVSRFLVSALNRERRPDHPQRLKRFRSRFFASPLATPFPLAICSTAV